MNQGPLVPPEAGRSRNSPLETLMRSALRISGNFSPNRVAGEVIMMLIEFANETLDDVRDHEYWDPSVLLDDYISQTDIRPVPDSIIVKGLLARYLLQQSSAKADLRWREYQAELNTRLFHLKYGPNQQFFITPMDKGPIK